MNVLLHPRRMGREQFLDWAERQEGPYEFDGTEPQAMTGGNRGHAEICSNLAYALRRRLEGTSWRVLPEAGVAVGPAAVRYPDVLLTATAGPRTDRLMPDPVVVFEVVSPTSHRVDRVTKLREYRTVPSILRYVIIDSAVPDVLVLSREPGVLAWTADVFGPGETLPVPEAGVELPMDEIYAGVAP